MTAQTGDIIYYEGKKYFMASEPPINPSAAKKYDIRFIWQTTACWRGYQAEWEVKDKQLFINSITGTAEVRETFKIPKAGTIAGCFVIDGKINRNSKVRLIRDGIVIYTGELGSLKRFKDDVKEVARNFECGLNIANFNDIKIGDHVEAYEEKEVKRSL